MPTRISLRMSCMCSSVLSIVLLLFLSPTLGFARQSTSPETAASLATEAQHYAAEGDWSRALESARALTRLQPLVAEAHANLGMIAYAAGEYSEAKISLQKAVRLKPSLVRARFYLGMACSQLGAFSEAAGYLSTGREQLKEPELRRLTGLHLLRCKRALGDTGEAARLVESLLGEFPHDPDVLYEAGQFYSERATYAIRGLVNRAPGTARFYQAFGELYESRGDPDHARQEYEKALQLAPEMPGIRLRIGRLLLASKNKDEIEQSTNWFTKELRIDPGSAEAEYEMGEAFRKLGDSGLALQHFGRAVQLDGKFVEALVALGGTEQLQGDSASAISHLERAVHLDPDNEIGLYRLARLYRAAGRPEAEATLHHFQEVHARANSANDRLMRTLMGGSPTPQTETDDVEQP